MPFLVLLYYISLSHTHFLPNSYTQYRLGHVVALATQNGLLRAPRIHCYGSEWLYCSALRFVPPAPEVFAEIKTTIFYNAFCLLILRLELSPNAI